MLGIRYVVQPGDTLWGLAGRFFGDPADWPLIHQHNNSAQAIAATGCRISDPNLIFVGQVIYVPDQRPQAALPSPSPQAALQNATPIPRHPDSFPKARQTVRGIPFNYKLEKLPSITAVSPSHIATLKLSGSVTIQPQKAYKFADISRIGFKIQTKQESDLIFGKLIADSKAGWKPSAQEVTFENSITRHSGCINPPASAEAAGFSSPSRRPVFKADLQYPSLTGTVEGYMFATQNLGVEIEIEVVPMPLDAKPRPVPAASPESVDVLQVATIVEDICAKGKDISDGTASYAEASFMLRPGLRLSTNVRGVAPLRIPGAGRPHGLQPPG